MKKYTHIFFDLDRTIWDYERNAAEAIAELVEKYNLHKRGITNTDDFVKSYGVINDRLWDDYGKNRITKEELRSQRFHLAFLEYGINDYNTAGQISEDFTNLAVKKTHLLPGAQDLLEYLRKKYEVHLITNGFEDTQKEKLKHSRIAGYFGRMITSERAGAKKPSKEIFEFALKECNAKASCSLMVGDNFELDVLGAKSAGLDQVYYFPEANGHLPDCTYTIRHLSELHSLL